MAQLCSLFVIPLNNYSNIHPTTLLSGLVTVESWYDHNNVIRSDTSPDWPWNESCLHMMDGPSKKFKSLPVTKLPLENVMGKMMKFVSQANSTLSKKFFEPSQAESWIDQPNPALFRCIWFSYHCLQMIFHKVHFIIPITPNWSIYIPVWPKYLHSSPLCKKNWSVDL